MLTLPWTFILCLTHTTTYSLVNSMISMLMIGFGEHLGYTYYICYTNWANLSPSSKQTDRMCSFVNCACITADSAILHVYPTIHKVDLIIPESCHTTTHTGGVFEVEKLWGWCA